MFSSLHDIRQEAGVIHYEKTEPVYELDRKTIASGDGSTTVFYVEHYPLVDKDGDADLDTADVTVYVEGVAVSVASVDGSAGTVTLTSAPTLGQRIDIDYTWSTFTNAVVTQKQAEANAMILSVLATIYSMAIDDVSINPDFSGSTAEYFLQRTETLLAAAYLLKMLDSEEDSPQYQKAIEKESLANDTLKAIQERRLVLMDSNYSELSRTDTMKPEGYPNSATTPADEAPIFDIADQL